MLTEREGDLVLTRFLSPPTEEIPQYIKDVEELMTSTEALRTRLIFIEELGEGKPSPIKKLTKQELLVLVREGIVGAYNSGKISAEKVLSLPHQAESMGDFVFILFSTPIEELAECMRKTREAPLPFDVPDIDIEKVMKEAEKRSNKPTI